MKHCAVVKTLYLQLRRQTRPQADIPFEAAGFGIGTNLVSETYFFEGETTRRHTVKRGE